ncbi:YoaK family protein [Deinococcus ficus]|uniref:DUF1275 family protein n=1 Tax=Deinococcus ficus TaxID=317577 RepID=A0A221T271_9DEIO|nr:YoaK family protein [Deinococcus ficus]ASN82960.1 DUF1275 family protein [Deinococcus ficus]
MTLAGVAGFVDAVGATLLGGLFVSFMSGNTTTAGLSLGQGGWTRALHAGLPVPLYVLGAVCGTLLLGQAGRRARPLAFLLTAVFLSLFGLLAHASPETEWKQGPVATSLLVFPMGVMNAMLRSVGRTSVGLTYITGSLSSFAETLAGFLAGQGGPGDRRKLRLYGGLWLSFFLGAALGGLTVLHWSVRAVAVPVLLLLVLAAVTLRGELLANDR